MLLRREVDWINKVKELETKLKVTNRKEKERKLAVQKLEVR